MKIEIKNKQINNPSDIDIFIDKQSDYLILYELIKVGDIIETKIRRKDKSLKIPIFYAIVELIVENIEYITDQTETVHIIGKISSSDNQNLREGTKQSIWITDGCEIRLKKQNWNEDELNILEELINPKPQAEQQKSLASPKDLQTKCFDILHKYMAKQFSLVSYGAETIRALEDGAVKVLFVTEEYINKQNDELKHSLSSEDHKYHGANIVVYDKKATDWEELTNFGGVIGVLKYNYFPQSENTN